MVLIFLYTDSHNSTLYVSGGHSSEGTDVPGVSPFDLFASGPSLFPPPFPLFFFFLVFLYFLVRLFFFFVFGIYIYISFKIIFKLI